MQPQTPAQHAGGFAAPLRLGAAALAVALCLLAGCRSVGPSNDRRWTPDQSRLAYAEIEGDEIRVHNVRNCTYFSEDDYLLDYYDVEVKLGDLQSVDFFVVPFADNPNLAHTMLSFGFANGRRLAASVEIRREEGETYEIWKGFANQYELIYVLGDENDLVKLRTHYRGEDVYLYRGKATPAQARALLLDVLTRVNKLADEPEFYHALWNNCTTNIAQHINRISPNRIPYDVGVLLPGYSDRLAYDLGLIDAGPTFEETRRRAYIDPRTVTAGGRDDFSAAIRR